MRDITLEQLYKILIKRWLLIVTCAVLGGVIAFLVSSFVITPMYSSNSSAYVYNKSLSEQSSGDAINASDITVSQELVSTYGVILKSNRFLDRVRHDADVDYSVEELKKMVTFSSVDDTEIMQIKVVCDNAGAAMQINQAILDNAYDEIQAVTDGGYISKIDDADYSEHPVSPNKRLNTIYGILIGLILSSVYAVVRSVLNTVIVSEEDFVQKFEDISIVGRIPQWEDLEQPDEPAGK